MIDGFRAELEAAGICPGEIIADSQLHRCPTQDKPGSMDAAYVFHSDNPPSGWWQNWRTGQEGTWTAKGGKPLSGSERQALARRIEADRKRREEEQAQRWAEAAQRAGAMLDRAEPCQAHPYLERKGVVTCARLKQGNDGALLVPVLDHGGQIQSLQTITPQGEKRFLSGRKMAGGYIPIGTAKDGPLLVCEGLATGLSLHQATSHTTLAAFNAGNLKAVAEMARERYPDRAIIVCGDDDRQTKGNPGVTKAREAARAVNGLLALPVFGGDQPGTDFNDLHRAEGLEVVKAQVEAASTPESRGSEAETSTSSANRQARDWPFRVSDSGVYRLTEKENAQTGKVEKETAYVCSRLDVLAETRDTAGQSWGRLLAIRTREGQVNQWAMPMSMLAGSGETYRAELLSLGLEIAPGSKARYCLQEYISTARPGERCRCVNRTGWDGEAFILPDASFGNTGGERVLFQAASAGDHPYRQAGTLATWQENVAALCVGNSRLAFAVSCALAAPLIYLAGMESGGIHFRGGSSLGKTTALLVAGSVWGGGGVSGYIRNWRSTGNGLEAVAQAHCDTLLCLDEMGQVDAREAGGIAYMLSNGQGKTRANRTGGRRPAATWRVLFLSTGELSLAEKMREAGQRAKAGQEVRLVDVPADAGHGLGLFKSLHNFGSAAEMADHLRLASQAHYGHAAHAFLEAITHDLPELGKVIRQAIERFMADHCPADADGQVKRVCSRFGLIAAAGELGGAAGVLPWLENEAVNAAGKCFLDWLEERGGTGPSEINKGLAQVRRFFQAHGASRFVPWGDPNRPVINRAGFVEHDEGGAGDAFYVFGEVFRDEVCQGFDPKVLARELISRGLLSPSSAGEPTTNKRLPGMNRPQRVYVITSAVLGGE
jgi:putative DNA primase/helicase